MADKTEEHLDADYSGRPYRLPAVEECLEYASANPQSVMWTDGFEIELPDGRYAILGGGNPSTGIWFLRGQDGQPDLNQRIDVEAELNKVGRTLKPPER